MAKATKKNKKGKTPKELVQKHILDQKDIISEEEFKNMTVGLDVLSDEKKLDLPDTKDRPKDEDKDPATQTPWNIINE